MAFATNRGVAWTQATPAAKDTSSARAKVLAAIDVEVNFFRRDEYAPSTRQLGICHVNSHN